MPLTAAAANALAEYGPGPQLYSYMGGRERDGDGETDRQTETEKQTDREWDGERGGKREGRRACTHREREREREREKQVGEGQKTCFVATKMILVAAPANDTNNPLPSLSQGPSWFLTRVIQVAQPPFHPTDGGGS